MPHSLGASALQCVALCSLSGMHNSAPHTSVPGLQSLVDLTGLFRVWNPRYKTWSIFGQDHLAKVLLGWDTAGASHDAVGDALKSIRLFNLYGQLQAQPEAWRGAQVVPLRGSCGAACMRPSEKRHDPDCMQKRSEAPLKRLVLESVIIVCEALRLSIQRMAVKAAEHAGG